MLFRSNFEKTQRKTKKSCPRLAQKNVLHDIAPSYCLIYSWTYQLIQVAIVVPPSIQPRPYPLRLLFVFRIEKKKKKKKWLTGNQGGFDVSCKSVPQQYEGWAQDYGNSNIFLKPLFRGNLDPFVNNANLGAIAHTSNGT